MSLASFLILLFAIQMGWMARQCHFIQVSVYSWVQGRIQDLAQRGDKSGAKRKKKFVVPPWAPQGGDRGGQNLRGRGKSSVLSKKIQENIKKKICVPPLNHSGGGDILAVPPLNCSGGGQSSGGGPPGQSPIPPPLYPLLCSILTAKSQTELRYQSIYRYLPVL